MKSGLIFLAFSFLSFSAMGEEGAGVGVLRIPRALDISPYTFVDPLRGRIGNYQLKTSDGLVETRRRGDYPIVSKDQNFDHHRIGVDAHFFASEFFKRLKSRFNRNGVDGAGTPVKIAVGMKYEGFAFDACGRDFRNRAVPSASWDHKSMTAYFSGDSEDALALSSSLDILAHELAHGIISSSSKLDAHAEARALNEAFADIMGVYMESQIQPDTFDWTMGEDVHHKLDCSGLRDLSDPTRHYFLVELESGPNEAPSVGKEPIRDHYSDIYRGEADGGGVHINSGIGSLAFYLLANGGSHPRLGGEAIQGVGIEAAIDVFYHAFTRELKSDSRYPDLKQASIKAAQNNPQALKSIKAVWRSLGL